MSRWAHGPLAGWMRGERGRARSTSQGQPPGEHQAPWFRAVWLVGVDYFSSLGYAPGIAYLSAGYLAPVATVLLVLVTFFAAVPTYALVARHSPAGDGSVKMIERLTTGWGRLGWLGKTLVLVLIGFAMTSFVLTITLSAADSAVHILENPLWSKHVTVSPVWLTALMICLLGLIFLRGFKEAIQLAALIAVPYMVLNAVVIGAGLREIATHPTLLAEWWARLSPFDPVHLRTALNEVDPVHALDPLNWVQAPGTWTLALVSLAVFPKLALGLSGFETSVSVMPLIRGETIADRVRNTRKMLVFAALLMSLELIGSAIVTTVLIPHVEFGPGGRAHGRALAYLAHAQLGELFGSVYDLSTVLILWFAGASAMAGLLNIIPRYLPRFGMSPQWIEYRRPLVLVITGICLAVNWGFQASVEKQGAAYATGVLTLIASGALAVLLAEWKNPRRRLAFGAILGVFGYVLTVNLIERPEGLRIAAAFVLATVAASIWSRWHRASELRVQGLAFEDAESEALFAEAKEAAQLVLIPLRSCDAKARHACAARHVLHLEIEKNTLPVWLHIELTEDPSEFSSPIRVKVRREAGDVVVEVKNAVAVANAIAYVAIELEADEVAIGLLDSGTPVVNALLYLLFGTGEVGYAVRAIFRRLKEERLDAELRLRKGFDRERDQREREALRAMIDLSPEERSRVTRELFEAEAAEFQSLLPTGRHIPRLILID